MKNVNTEGMKQAKLQRWKRTCLSFFLALSMVLPSIGMVEATGETTNLSKSEQQTTGEKTLFIAPDIKGHWAEEVMQDFVQKGYAKGFPDGTMKPNQTISRAEFIALVNHVYNYQEKAPISYRDVPANAWFYQEIAKAAKAGYISGFEDGTMHPTNAVTRQEAATIVARLQNLTENPDGTNKLADRQAIPSWSKGVIGAVIQAGYMKGMPDGTFQPAKPMTRAEAMTILHNVMKTFDETKAKDLTKQATTYDKAGTYGGATASEKETVQGDVIINAAGVNLQNLVVEGNLIIDKAVGEGEVSLKNVTVKGELFVNGGGKNSVYLIDSTIETIAVNKQQGDAVRIVVRGKTTINNLEIETTTIVVIEGGVIQSITIRATAPNTVIDAKNSAEIGELLIQAISKVLGGIAIKHVTINVNGVTIEGNPQKVTLANGNSVMINGQLQTSSTAANIGGGSGDSSGSGPTDTTAQDTIDVATAKAALQIGFTSGDTISFVTSDLILDDSGVNGTTISWASDKPRIIAANGTVTRPSFTLGNQDVTLTATITKGSIRDMKEFKITVIKLAETQDDRDVADAKSKLEIIFTSGDSITLVTSNLSLPTTGEHGTTITWESDKSYVQPMNGNVTRPYYTLGNQPVTLTATITKGNVYDTKTITITVREREQSTEARDNGFADGKGTVTEPYIITNADHLNNIRNHSDKYFMLAANVDMNQSPYNSGLGWEPIQVFEGSLNGKGYKISNLMINRPNDSWPIGLFKMNKGKISNVILDNVNVTGNRVVGGFVGENLGGGSIYNIDLTGTVAGEELVGGFVGQNEGEVAHVTVNGTVTASINVGGFAGVNMGTISNSRAMGTVKGENSIAGFAGFNGQSGKLLGNYTTAMVSGTDSVVGFVLFNQGTVMNNYATGNITGTNFVAGFVVTNNGTITNNYTTGNVTGKMFVVGFVGANDGTITNNYASGVVTAEGLTDGFIDQNNGGTISSNYFNSKNAIQQPITGVTGVSLADMTQKATFNNWDFTTVWDITNNKNHPYPYLRNNPDYRLR